LDVLLVEPSLAQRRIVSRMLNELQISKISVAKDGAAAQQEMRRHIPDLLISSLYLPDMTGTELLTAMKQDEQLEQIAFILISSETQFRYLDPVRQAGAVCILPKPFKQDELKTALHSSLEYLDPEEINFDDFDPENLEVLLVDDSPLMRKHMRRVLSAMGLEHFTEANDGKQALELINGRFFDLVVTDYNMPHMDGRELIDHVRSRSGQASVPILMVTSETDEQRLAAVQKAGVSAILDKPFEPGSVRQLLRQIMGDA
jgi:two-component system chemotaxis response regulator CheY